MSGHNATPELHEHADSWHHHEKTEGMPQSEHLAVLNVRSISVWGSLTVVALAIFMIALGMYFTQYTNSLKQDKQERKGWSALSKESRAARDRAELLLSTGTHVGNDEYSWAPEGGDKVTIPMNKAMDKVIADYSKR